MLSSIWTSLHSILYSLRLRLILMFMLIVMVAVGTVALIASQATATNLQVYTQQKNDQQIISTLRTAYQQHQSEQALQLLTDQLAHRSQQRIILLDPKRRVIADSDHALTGQTLPDTTLTYTTTSSGNNHVTTLTIYASTDLSTQPSPSNDFGIVNNVQETSFLSAVNQSLWLAVLIAGLAALLLALIFSSTLLKPLHTLKTAAGRMERGDLNQRVVIKGKGEVSALAHAFNTMADSLNRSEQARRSLVSDVAHELRNPLMNIRGYLELFTEGVIEPTPETLTSLYEETSLLTRLVADLQDLSLAEAGQLRLARRPIELGEVVNQAVQIVQPQLENKRLRLNVSLPPHLPYINADPERVAQILRNLLSNAIIHTSAPGEIRITAHLSEAMVHINVEDTGTGIEPEHIPYLFERFYRADSSRSRATGGTGLGLAIVKQMVQAHNGHITISSKPGKGTRFTFTLPLPNSLLFPSEISGRYISLSSSVSQLSEEGMKFVSH